MPDPDPCPECGSRNTDTHPVYVGEMLCADCGYAWEDPLPGTIQRSFDNQEDLM